MSDGKVKQDINLLEYPLWFQDECEAENNEKGFVWEHPNGPRPNTRVTSRHLTPNSFLPSPFPAFFCALAVSSRQHGVYHQAPRAGIASDG